MTKTNPYIGIDTFTLKGTTPVAAAKRFLHGFGHRILVTRDGDHMEIYITSGKSGIWTKDENKVKGLIKHSIKNYSKYTSNQKVKEWSKLRAGNYRLTNEIYANLGTEIANMEEEGTLPDSLKLTTPDMIDNNLNYLGAPNGVIDLNTGVLLTGIEASEKYVTRHIKDDYNPKVNKKYRKFVLSLLKHLDEDTRKYFLDSLGFMIRGRPSRRWYVLRGEQGGGKSTWMKGICAALNNGKNGYSMGMKIETILEDKYSNSSQHDAGIIGIQETRIAYIDEAPPHTVNKQLNTSKINMLSGGNEIAIREVGKAKGPDKQVTASIVLSINPYSESVIHMGDASVKVRTKIIDFPPLDINKAKVNYEARVKSNKNIRQAFIAILVRYARKNRLPPNDIESVKSAVEDRTAESMGAHGDWVNEYMMQTNNSKDILFVSDVGNAFREYFGVNDQSSKGYKSDGAITKIVQRYWDLHKLPKKTQKQHDKKRGMAWIGAKLKISEQETKYENGEMQAAVEETEKLTGTNTKASKNSKEKVTK